MRIHAHLPHLVILARLGWSLSAGAATIQYTYDDAGRLTRADYGGGAKIDYVYDANGNLLQRTVTADGEVAYTLIYRAGTGGAIVGAATQQVAAGASGTAVEAVASAGGAAFHAWSDGRATAARTDTNVQANLNVLAMFRSTGGADLDWYAARGLVPGGGETWGDVDARAVPAKGTTLLRENLADTDPDDPNDVFRVTAVSNGPPLTIRFQPGSTGRVYTLQFATDLVGGTWSNVPGQGPRPGAGGPDMLVDTNALPARFHRVNVELP